MLFVWVPTVKKCAVRVNYCQWDSLAARAEQVLSFVDLFHKRQGRGRLYSLRICIMETMPPVVVQNASVYFAID